MNTRYEVIDETITEIREDRTALTPYAVASAMNSMQKRIKDQGKQISLLRRKLSEAQEGWSNTGNDLSVRDGQLAEGRTP